MLQIASGKLFTRSFGRKNDLRGTLYTNLRFTSPIETVAGTVFPAGSKDNPGAVVYEMKEYIEGEVNGPGVLVSHGVDPYLHDFATVASFALNATCHPSTDLTRRLISGRRSTAVPDAPGSYVKRMFDPEVWLQPSDALLLPAFTEQIVGLDRRSFLAAMRAVRTYVTAMHRIADDLELAYTLFVASIESLVQDFDNHEPTWSDFEQSKRTAIDTALHGAAASTSAQVREALLKIEHLSLGRRFRDFVLAHVQSSYFREEATGCMDPVGRADLPGSLKEAYSLRSKYIHTLQQLPRVLHLSNSYRETAIVNRATTLTLQGISRLAQHVIREFVRRQPKVATQPYDYSLERHGVVQIQMAPEYWVGNAVGMSAKSGRQKLEGHVEQWTAHLLRIPGATVTDMRDVLAKAKEMMPNMTQAQRRPFLAIYLLFNAFARTESRMADYEEKKVIYGTELDVACEEAIITFLIFGVTPGWPLGEHDEAHARYFRRRDKDGGLRIPRTLEAGLSLSLAERHRVAGNLSRTRELIGFAVDNYPGNGTLRSFEENFVPSEPIDWETILLPRKEAAVID